MKDIVVIKSYSNGLSILLDKEADFHEISEQVILKFEASKAFFGNAKMAISFENRILTNDEELELIQLIQLHSGIQVLAIVGKNKTEDDYYTKTILDWGNKTSQNETIQFYKGSITDGQSFECDSNIVILGDIYPGCSVTSNKSIVVLGGIYGKVYAGYNGQEGAFIYATEMEPERLCIHNVKMKLLKKSFWGLKQKHNPQIAFINDEQVVLEHYTKDILKLLD